MHAQCAFESLHMRKLTQRAVGATSRAVLGLAIMAAAACSAGSSADESEGSDLTVIAIDRTGVAGNGTWPVDVASQVMATVESAIGDDVESVDLIGIGSTPGDSLRLATIDLLHIGGNTRAKREAARQEVIATAGATARQLAEQPVTTNGTDVIAALTEAVALCQDPAVTRCSIVVASDLEDQRVTRAPSVDAAVDALLPLMPDLDGIPVTVTGLGASGADSALVTKVSAAWDALLRASGASNVRIARSL
jgi:hypothetical protein